MEPGWLFLGLPWAALALLLLVVLPGVALGPVLAPGPVSPIERLARVLGGGVLVSSAAMLGLALTGMLRPTIVVAVLVGLTILPLHGRRPRRPSAGRLTTRGMATLAALPAAVVVAAPALLAGPGGGLGSLPAEWAGSSAAISLTASGGLPIVAPAWAAERVLLVRELPGVAHLAAVVQLLPGDMLARLAIDRLAMTAVVLVVTAALLRRWLPSWAAALGAGLFVGLGSVATPVLDDAAGSRTMAVAVFGLWLTDRALVDRRARLVASAGLAAGLVLVSRPDAFLATCAGIAGLASARWLVAPGGGPENAGGLGHRHGRRLGLRFSARRTALAPISAALVVVAIGGGAGGVVDRFVRLADPVGDV